MVVCCGPEEVNGITDVFSNHNETIQLIGTLNQISEVKTYARVSFSGKLNY